MARNSRKAGRTARAAARASTRSIGSLLFFILKVIGTVLLITVTTAVMFSVIFAFYIKTTIQSQIGITFEEYELAQTSYMYYNGADSTKTSTEGDEGEEEETDAEFLENASGEDDEEEETSDSDNLNAEDAKLWTEIKSKYQRTWVDSDEIPQYMRDAAVAIEDKRFYEHDGVDWYRTAGAFYTMFFRGNSSSSFGASTVTQQLIKNLTKEDDVTVKRKIVEIFRALEVEKNYSKDEILTWYLNVIYLGQNSYGIQAASQTYFGKDVGDLSLAECAAIIGITNRPTKYDPYYSEEQNKKRQEDILEEMYEQNYITYEEYDAAVKEELSFKTKQTVEEGETQVLYSYYQETVLNDVIKALQEELDLSEQTARDKVFYGGYNIYACIDQSIQDSVDSIYEDLSEIPNVKGGSGQQVQSAITIQDPETGYIVALSGGVGEKDTNFGFNRATDATRPPGSSIKPLTVYGPALDTNVITTSSTYIDSPITLKNGDTWPQNDNRNWSNEYINITTAVQRSINTIAVRVLQETGTDIAYEYLTERLGVTTGVVDADVNLAPLALGQLTNGATVREMTSAYSAIANDGMYTESKTFYLVTDANGETVIDNRDPKSSIAFKEATTDTLTALLYNAVQNGTGKEAKLSSGMAVAGKTGTTGNKKDRWFCGYTPYYVAAVWTGFDKQAEMSISGNPAAQLWKKVMTLVHEDLKVISKFDTGTVISGSGGSGSKASPSTSASPSSSGDEDTTATPSTSPSPSAASSPSAANNAPASSAPATTSSAPATTDNGGGGGEGGTQPDTTATIPPEVEYGQEQNVAYKRKDGKRGGGKKDES